MPEPKVIFIDWNKTLSESHFWRHFPEAETVMFLANRELLNPWMRGECTSEKICQTIAEETTFSESDIFNDLKESCAVMEFVDHEVPELIRKIRARGIRVVLATDNMDCFSRFTVPALKLRELFDDVLISCDMKILKVEVWESCIPFFKKFLTENNLTYADTVLLDDSDWFADEYERLGLAVTVIENKEKLLATLRGYAGE
jgi:FMN phosphatase YigB (HAD superfamily)